jgi:ferredoxin
MRFIEADGKEERVIGVILGEELLDVVDGVGAHTAAGGCRKARRGTCGARRDTAVPIEETGIGRAFPLSLSQQHHLAL